MQAREAIKTFRLIYTLFVVRFVFFKPYVMFFYASSSNALLKVLCWELTNRKNRSQRTSSEFRISPETISNEINNSQVLMHTMNEASTK